MAILNDFFHPFFHSKATERLSSIFYVVQ